MLDLYSDFTQHQGQLGTHIEIVEMCDLAALVRAATEREIRAKEEEALAIFELAEDSPSDPLAVRPAPEALDWAYRVAVGLDRLVADFALDGLTYYYRGLDHNEYERIAAGFALGCSLLTSRGVPCSGEGNLKNCQAMKIVDTVRIGRRQQRRQFSLRRTTSDRRKADPRSTTSDRNAPKSRPAIRR